jgi:hypothetical protein
VSTPERMRTFTGIYCSLDGERSPRGRQASCRVRRLVGGWGAGAGVVVTEQGVRVLDPIKG